MAFSYFFRELVSDSGRRVLAVAEQEQRVQQEQPEHHFYRLTIQIAIGLWQ